MFLDLQDALKSEEAYNMNEDLKNTLSQLASLSNHKNSKVALAARQVGVASRVAMEIVSFPWECYSCHENA